MKPTVGRIVHYVSYGTPGGEYQPEHRAAVIAGLNILPGEDQEIHSVSLVVLNPNGLFFNTEVFQDEHEKRGGTWHWPERDEE